MKQLLLDLFWNIMTIGAWVSLTIAHSRIDDLEAKLKNRK